MDLFVPFEKGGIQSLRHSGKGRYPGPHCHPRADGDPGIHIPPFAKGERGGFLSSVIPDLDRESRKISQSLRSFEMT
jgi:hypothetical protein